MILVTKCEGCKDNAIGFYVKYEWCKELEAMVTTTGAYLCEKCRVKWGFE